MAFFFSVCVCVRKDCSTPERTSTHLQQAAQLHKGFITWMLLSPRAPVHFDQMGHRLFSLCTKLDPSCPSVLQPRPQEIKSRCDLSEWSPSLAHSSWGGGGKSKPTPWEIVRVGEKTHMHTNTHTQAHTGVSTLLLVFTQGHKLTVARCCQLCGNTA